MVETEIKIGPIRPTSGPLAKTGGAAISSQSGSGPLDGRVRLNEQDIRSLQDQIYAISGLLNLSISVPMLIASGPNHQPGVAPDPGSTAGTAKFLREDSTWTAVSATALTGIVPVANGGTGTATGSITGTGALTFTSGGATKVILKPGTDSTTAVQVQNAAGAAVVSVDTTNGNVGIGTTTIPVGGGVVAGRTYLSIKGSTLAAVLELAHGAADAAGTMAGQMSYVDPNVSVADKRIAILNVVTSGATANNRGGAFVFLTKVDAGALAEAMRIDDAGNVLIGVATAGASKLRVHGLPTSAAGLSTDDIWVDTGAGNVLKIV